MSQDQFESPGQTSPGQELRATEGFESPESVGYAEAESAEIEAFVTAAGPRVLEAKAAFEAMLSGRTGEGVTQAFATRGETGNVIGVGIGLADAADGVADGLPGEAVLEVYTVERASSDEVRSAVSAALGVSAAAAGEIPVRAVHTGIVDAYPHRMRLRPAPGGISCGNVAITAGTLGCLARGRSAPWNNRVLILSNNHVLADTNRAPINSAIIQPGRSDGGSMPGDQIAILSKFVPINPGGVNYVDCAFAWAWPDRVRREQMYVSGGIRYFNTGAVPVAPAVGLAVGKSGRTTQLTSGRVTAVGVTVNVNFGVFVAQFRDQISVRSTSGNFSQPGDSGSLIWTWDARRAPVGLLFAGGGGTTFANRIGRVLDALDINIFA